MVCGGSVMRLRVEEKGDGQDGMGWGVKEVEEDLRARLGGDSVIAKLRTDEEVFWWVWSLLGENWLSTEV